MSNTDRRRQGWDSNRGPVTWMPRALPPRRWGCVQNTPSLPASWQHGLCLPGHAYVHMYQQYLYITPGTWLECLALGASRSWKKEPSFLSPNGNIFWFMRRSKCPRPLLGKLDRKELPNIFQITLFKVNQVAGVMAKILCLSWTEQPSHERYHDQQLRMQSNGDVFTQLP